MEKKNKGFTLIEMLIVVVIIAVLTTVAVIAYSRHIRKGRIMKERVFVSNIQSMQETYFQQTGFYLNVTSGGYDPATVPNGDPLSWNSGVFSKWTNWETLGARPESGVTYMHWDVTASVPSAHAFTGSASSLGLTSGRPWYYVHARANLGGAAAIYTELYATSQKSDIWIVNEGQ